jgi:hypothetical protein
LVVLKGHVLAPQLRVFCNGEDAGWGKSKVTMLESAGETLTRCTPVISFSVF